MVVGHNPTFEALVAALPESPDPVALGRLRAPAGWPCSTSPVARWDEIAPRIATVFGVFLPPF